MAETPLGHIVVALDIETTGDRMGRHGLVAIGAAAIDVATETVIETLLLKVDTRDKEWDADCVAEFWDKNAAMRTALTSATNVGTDVILSQDAAVRQLHVWLAALRRRAQSLRLLSDMPEFDGGWLDWALAAAGLPPLYLPERGVCKGILDTSSFYEGLKAGARSPVPHVDMKDLPWTHNPCDDALNIGMKHLRTLRAFGVEYRP